MFSEELDRELNQLDKDFESGQLDAEEYNRLVNEVQREYRSLAREAVERAYEDEINNRWW